MLALGFVKRTTWILYDIASLEWTGHATRKPRKATWLSKPTAKHMSVCRPAAAHGGSIVVGHGTVASCPDKGSGSCLELFQASSITVFSPLPWRHLSSLMRPFGARLQS